MMALNLSVMSLIKLDDRKIKNYTPSEHMQSQQEHLQSHVFGFCF